MLILQQPDALSLSQNLKEFRITSTERVSFILKQESEVVFSQSYEPDKNNVVVINIRDIVHSHLSFKFVETSLVYRQPSLTAVFVALIDTKEISFQVVKAGVDHLADSAINFLQQNFLTWQPTIKPVTYYSPEFLTYYAVNACSIKLRAYFTNDLGEVVSEQEKTLYEFSAGNAYTIPLQYAIIAGNLENQLPGYYDVWVEGLNGLRLTYIQRYYASDILSEQEQWILFENSLGGIDTFRAYGAMDFNGNHTHNIAEIDEVSSEYRVDTDRKYQKNTGYLNRKERQWLLDFFPSLKKYIYTDSYFRSIIVVESNVTYSDKEFPSNYTFTYKYADAKPLMNLARTDAPPEVLNIVVPDVGSFTVPPRLVEFPRLPLSEGALFPVQEPYSENWSSTTSGSIGDFIINRISKNYGGGGGIGHQHENIDLLNLLAYAAGYLMIAGKRARVGYSDEALSFVDDIATRLIWFKKGIQSDNVTTKNYFPGLMGKGASLMLDPETGKSILEVDSASFREELIVPKITFNCIDVISGDKANTFSFGTIKSIDKETQIAELDLLDDQIGTLHVSDIIRGIFHNLEGSNQTDDSYDDNGFLNYAGFSTSYFTPTDIIESKPGRMVFRYELKSGTSVHPMKGMNFYAYGNFIDKDRQSITYENRYYTRRLKNVNTWVINPDKHIAMQDGLLEGLTIGGMTMHGYGLYNENNYFTGVQIQFTPEQKEELAGQDAYSVSLTTNESLVVVDDEGNLIGGFVDEKEVVTGENNVVSGENQVIAILNRFKTRVQAFKGSKELYYSEQYHADAYMISLNTFGCVATVDNGIVSVNEITDIDNCYILISVNCEGNSVFEKQYKITAVRNGTSTIAADLDNQMMNVACDTGGNVLSGLPKSTKVTMWYGEKELTIDRIELELPAGVMATADKNIVTITGIAQNAPVNMQIGVIAYATYAGTQYRKRLSLVINKIMPGADGSNAVIYELQTSTSSVKIDENGNYSDASLVCSVIRTDGNTTEVLSSLPSDMSIKYSADGNVEVLYMYQSLIILNGKRKGVKFNLYRSGTLIDTENIPIIIDGRSSVSYDLSNEMDSVACDADGNVLFGLPVQTTISMFYGTTKLAIDSVVCSYPGGVICDFDKTGLVSVKGIEKSVGDIINIEITAKATHANMVYERKAIFTVNKIKPGQNGISPIIYSLSPSVNSIKVDKNGNFIPGKVSCRVNCMSKTGTETLSSLPEGYKLFYSIDESQDLYNYVYGSELSISNRFNSSVKFVLKNDSSSIDIETIPILMDGIDGDDGDPGKDGKYTEIRYKYYSKKPDAPSSTSMTGWHLSPEKKEIEISQSGDMSLLYEGFHVNYMSTPLPSDDNRTYKQRLTFTTTREFESLVISIYIASVYWYRSGIVMKPDIAYTESSPNSDMFWIGRRITDTRFEIGIPSPGEHFIDIVYTMTMGIPSENKDYLRFRVIPQRKCWMSTSVIDPSSEEQPVWSDPVEFPTDSPTEEHIYLRTKTKVTADLPESDIVLDGYIGLPPYYNEKKSYEIGNVIHNDGFKMCIKPCTGILPYNGEYWESCRWWTNNPEGVSDEYPYEYACTRWFSGINWSAYSNYRLFMGLATSNMLVSSVTQIRTTMTGSYEPGSFTVWHKNSNGIPVNANLVAWGSDNGISWSKIESVDKVSSITVDVTKAPYRYFTVRSYSVSSPSWDSEYLLSISVNVLSDGLTGPMPVYCGFFEQGTEYTYTNTTRDIINYEIDGSVFTFQVKVHGARITVAPTSSTGDANWEPANKMKFVAMDTALIDGANIAGFMYKNLRMISRKGRLDGVEIDIKDVPEGRFADFEPNISMDGNTGEFVANIARIKGKIEADDAEISGFIKGCYKNDFTKISINGSNNLSIDLKKSTSYVYYVSSGGTYTPMVYLPIDKQYIGITLNIAFERNPSSGAGTLWIICRNSDTSFRYTYTNGKRTHLNVGTYVQLLGVPSVGASSSDNPSGIGNYCDWRIINSGDFILKKATDNSYTYFESKTPLNS